MMRRATLKMNNLMKTAFLALIVFLLGLSLFVFSAPALAQPVVPLQPGSQTQTPTPNPQTTPQPSAAQPTVGPIYSGPQQGITTTPLPTQPATVTAPPVRLAPGVTATATPTLGPIAGPSKCNNGNGISTALGCIPVNTTSDFVAWFLRWLIGIAGGIAFLMIVFSSFQIMTASGDPQKLQGGRELLTAAISGLVLIIFSVFLLRLIGVTILNIPGL